MNYKETLDILYNMLPDFQKTGAGAYKPGLERITEFTGYLNNPHKSFISIHVAGTNGKGSVCHIMASVLQSAGYRVGLFTSPHLHDFRERIKVDGEQVTERYVVDFTNAHLDKMNALSMSFFEATTAMAFDYFEKNDVEVAVIETGLGGRLDSTNILDPVLSIITNIGMDHQAFLGDTPQKIAAEKAGIIKKGVPVVVGEDDPEVSPVFEDKVQQVGTEITYADAQFGCFAKLDRGNFKRYILEKRPCGSRFEVDIDLHGDYQCKNIATVLAAAGVLNRKSPLNISTRAIKSGIATTALNTGLRGRWEIISRKPLTVCDTGHNAHGLKVVVEQIEAQKFRDLYMVIGVVNDKDLSGILPLLPKRAKYIFTQPSIPRALEAEKLSSQAHQLGLKGEVISSVKDAVLKAGELAGEEDMIFIGGSTFTVADALA